MDYSSDTAFREAESYSPEFAGSEANEAPYRKFQQAEKFKEPVVYEFTDDPALLHQYYQLRERMYTSVWKLSHFDGSEDEYDSISHILVARKGKLCVGGARITIKAPDMIMPLETSGLRLESALPEFDLKNQPYGEFSRLCLLPEFRQEYTLRMYHCLNRSAIALGLRYVFAISPVSQARGYKLAYRSLGIDTYRILRQVEIPQQEEYEGIPMCLSVLNLSEFIQPVAQSVSKESHLAV